MDKQTREAREQMKQLKGKEKWKNIWYYYRFHILAILFVIIGVSYTLTECMNKIDYDLNISFYGAMTSNPDGISNLGEVLKTVVDDTNENGSIDVDVAVNPINLSYNSEQTQAVVMKLYAELAGGDAFGYILDEPMYKMVTENYSECIDSIIPIENMTDINSAFSIPENSDIKLYWMTKTVYEQEKSEPERLAHYENAVKVQKYIESFSK